MAKTIEKIAADRPYQPIYTTVIDLIEYLGETQLLPDLTFESLQKTLNDIVEAIDSQPLKDQRRFSLNYQFLLSDIINNLLAAPLPFVPNFSLGDIPGIVAVYDMTDPANVTTTQVFDTSGSNNHSTRTGTLTYDAANTIMGGRGALVWPTGGSGNGLILPGMTIKEVIVVGAYKDGVDTTFDNFDMVLSGVSGTSDAPRIMANSGNGLWSGSSVMTGLAQRDAGANNFGRDDFVTSAGLGAGFRTWRFRAGTATTETEWRIGVGSDTPSRCWDGPISLVILSDRDLTQNEVNDIYGWINWKFGTKYPTISRVFERNSTGIIDKPASMGSDLGPYYAQIVDMRDDPVFPYDWACYFSTDHDAVGEDGIYLFVANGDPYVKANWIDYDVANASGAFDAIAGRPSGNPIYRDTVQGDQCETPHVLKVGSIYHLYYQQAGVGNNQSTLYATSPNGLVWTRQGVCIDYAAGTGLGDGHTGYFRPWLNPFSGVPFTYVGYSLHGGQNENSYYAQWGSNDAINWTKLGVLMKFQLRAQGQLSGTITPKFLNFDVASVKPMGDGTYSALCSVGTLSAGAGGTTDQIFEIRVDRTGRHILGVPDLVVPNGIAAAFDESSLATPWTFQYNGIDHTVYVGGNASNQNTVGILRNVKTSNIPAVFAPLSPAMPSSFSTDLYADFTQMSSLPSWLEIVSAGQTPPSFAFTANGLELTATSGSPNGEIWLFVKDGVIPQNVNFIEILTNEFRSLGAARSVREWRMGIADAKAIDSGITNMVFATNRTNSTTIGGLTKRRERAASVDTGGVGNAHGAGYSNDLVLAPKEFGLRWYQSTNEVFYLGASHHEFMKFTPTISRANTMFPFFGITVTGTVTEVLKDLRLRIG